MAELCKDILLVPVVRIWYVQVCTLIRLTGEIDRDLKLPCMYV